MPTAGAGHAAIDLPRPEPVAVGGRCPAGRSVWVFNASPKRTWLAPTRRDANDKRMPTFAFLEAPERD